MLCILGSLHAKRDKIIKNIKLLCWSETGNAVFKTMRAVFLLLAGDTLDVVIFYRVWMPCIMRCVLDARLALLYFVVVVRVFSRA